MGEFHVVTVSASDKTEKYTFSRQRSSTHLEFDICWEQGDRVEAMTSRRDSFCAATRETMSIIMKHWRNQFALSSGKLDLVSFFSTCVRGTNLSTSTKDRSWPASPP